MTLRYTFKEGERLKREVHIETLFRTGKAFSVFPLRFVHRRLPRAGGEEYALRAGFSASKKKFRRAHERNRVKRLMREAWRLHKHELAALVAAEEQCHLFLLCTATQIPSYAEVLAAVQKGISRLKKEWSAPPA